MYALEVCLIFPDWSQSCFKLLIWHFQIQFHAVWFSALGSVQIRTATATSAKPAIKLITQDKKCKWICEIRLTFVPSCSRVRRQLLHFHVVCKTWSVFQQLLSIFSFRKTRWRQLNLSENRYKQCNQSKYMLWKKHKDYLEIFLTACLRHRPQAKVFLTFPTDFVSMSHLCPPGLYPRDIEVGLTVAYVITMFVALAGNFMVIFIVWKKPETRCLTSFLFVNLAVTDLVVAVFLMPAVIFIFYYEGQWLLTGALGQVTCRLFFFLCFAVLSAPIVTHLAIAIDRFYAVLFPFRRLLHFRKAKTLIPLIWITTLLIMSPALLIAKLENNWCSFDFELLDPAGSGSRVFYIYVIVVMYIIPLTVMTVLYGLVGRKLWLHEVPGNISERAGRRNELRKRRIVNMLITIVTAFALCWFPVHVNHLLFAVDYDANFHAVPTAVFNWIGHSYSAINPWLLIVLSPKFSAAFVQIATNLRICENFRKKEEEEKKESHHGDDTRSAATAAERQAPFMCDEALDTEPERITCLWNSLNYVKELDY